MTHFGADCFVAQTMPGIERIAAAEIGERDPTAHLLGTRSYRHQNGIVLFSAHGDPRSLLQLRTTEDVFFLVTHAAEIPTDRTGLEVLAKSLREARSFEAGLRCHRELQGANRGRTTFRVVVRLQGHHAYRRSDVQRVVEGAIHARYPRWRLVDDRAWLEIWVTVLGREAFFGLRLSDETMRQRTYKHEHLPASLRPTVAAAMVRLSEPRPDDVFLDPMCGAGTILIERALAGRYRLLLGGDRGTDAVRVARGNVGPRYKPIEVRQWDATALPLDDASVDKLVSNLPFGEQIGSHEQNRALYPKLLAELVRVVRPGGRLVLLTGERALIRHVISGWRALRLRETYDVLLLGKSATIYVLDRGAA